MAYPLTPFKVVTKITKFYSKGDVIAALRDAGALPYGETYDVRGVIAITTVKEDS